MKSILLLFRHRNEGISIQKVFNIIIPHVARSYDIKCGYMPSYGAKWFSIIKNLIFALCCRKHKQIFHITGAVHYLTYVLPKSCTITTVHDLLMLKRAKSYSIIKKTIFNYLWGKSLNRNKFVVCISEKTKRELLDYVKIPEEKIVVIGDPLSDKYSYSPKMFNNDKPIILHIGTKSNKNLERTIEALKGIKSHLRIIGRLSQDQINLLVTSGIEYSNDYNISEDKMRQEYLNCDIVNFPSLYEGFGMPIIEAQGIGRVCMTSDISPMNEIAGKGALFVNPYEVDSLRKGYEMLIESSDLRNRLIELGINNAKLFRAKVIADKYKKVYEELNICK